MTERDQTQPGHPAAGAGEAVREHDPYYCVYDPETDGWLVVLKHLPGYLREAIFDKTEGADTPEDWQVLRQPNWATHVLHMQAAEGSEEAKRALADSVAVLPMPEGWDGFVEEHFRAGEPDIAPNYYPEYSSEAA